MFSGRDISGSLPDRSSAWLYALIKCRLTIGLTKYSCDNESGTHAEFTLLHFGLLCCPPVLLNEIELTVVIISNATS